MEEALRFVTQAQTERFTLTELCGRLVSGKSINVSRPDPFGLCVLDRHPRIERPAHKDPFCNQGKAWMKRVELPAADRQLLDDDLEMHELLDKHIRAIEDRIETDNAAHADALRLRTLPGVGKVLGPVIALEIDGVSRFKTADKFCAYAGLVPTTHSSGGKTSHGRMLPFCNRWLKWAFIEAAWVAIGCSDYFGSFYKRHRARGKGANEAITITARISLIEYPEFDQQNKNYDIPLSIESEL
jgi:transposase